MEAAEREVKLTLASSAEESDVSVLENDNDN